jgi:hypothetical protein
MSDLYDRLRPADEPLDVATAERVWARIVARHTNADPDTGVPSQDSPADSEWSSSPVDRPKSRRFAALLATAAAVVGLAGTALVVSTRDTAVAPFDAADPIAPGATEPFETAPTDPRADPSVEANSTASGPVDLATGTKFAVADYLPVGWELDAMEATSSGSLFGSTQWALLGDDGAVTGVVSVRAPRPMTAEDAARNATDDFNTTVRGIPANEYQQDSDGSGNVAYTGLDWVEESLQISLTATGEAEPLARSVAEEVVIDPATRSVSIPDELGLVPAAELEFADPDAVTTIIGMSPTSSTLGVIINTRPNTFGYGLDQLVGSELDWQPSRIDDRDARVATTPGGSRQVAWLNDDMYVTVMSTTTMTDDELFEIIRGVRFTDADEFQAIVAANAAQEQADLISWNVFDRTTTRDGLDVTVRARPGSSGANAICLEISNPVCSTLISEGGTIDGFETYGSAAFAVGDAMIGVAWVSNELEIDGANQVQRPAESTSISVRPSDFLNPADGYIDGTTATIVADTQTDRGRFVIVAFPATERPPSIQFATVDDDAPTAPLFELTPTVVDPFDFG